MSWKLFDFENKYYLSLGASISLSIGLLINLLGFYAFYESIHSFMNFGAAVTGVILGLPATLPFFFTGLLYSDLSVKSPYLFESSIILVNLIFYYVIGSLIGWIYEKVKNKEKKYELE